MHKIKQMERYIIFKKEVEINYHLIMNPLFIKAFFLYFVLNSFLLLLNNKSNVTFYGKSKVNWATWKLLLQWFRNLHAKTKTNILTNILIFLLLIYFFWISQSRINKRSPSAQDSRRTPIIANPPLEAKYPETIVRYIDVRYIDVVYWITALHLIASNNCLFEIVYVDTLCILLFSLHKEII